MALEDYGIQLKDLPSPRSAAFEQFLAKWFIAKTEGYRGEWDLSYVKEFAPGELDLARQLLRRNLDKSQTRFVEGVALLGDVSAVPVLQEMYDKESDESRRLTIAGSLWQLAKDERFYESIRRMVEGGNATLKQAHFHDIELLGDGRAIEAIFDLLEDRDSFVRFLALNALNRLEHGRAFWVPAPQLPSQREHYLAQRGNLEFRQRLTKRLRSQVGCR